MSALDFLELLALGSVLGMIAQWCVKRVKLWRARRYIKRWRAR